MLISTARRTFKKQAEPTQRWETVAAGNQAYGFSALNARAASPLEGFVIAWGATALAQYKGKQTHVRPSITTQLMSASHLQTAPIKLALSTCNLSHRGHMATI